MGIMCTPKEIELSNSKAYLVPISQLLNVILKNNSIRKWFTNDLKPDYFERCYSW